MIEETHIFRQTLHFNTPFEIAYEKVEEADVVIVKIVTENGLTGLGNAAPDTEVTGETIEAVQSILQQRLTPDFFSEPIESWYHYHLKIQETFQGFPSAQAAVEDAVLNIWSQKKGIPLHVFFGGFRQECPTMITVGIKGADETEQEIRRRLEEGYKTIKMKCGLNASDDIARIIRADKLLPADVRLILDANQGYSVSDAEKVLKAVDNLKIELIEQPVDAKDVDGLAYLYRQSSIAVVADEAVVSVDDAYRFLLSDTVAGVNIKLMKCGGPVNFTKIFHLAKKLNKIIMLGCMYESHISMTSGAHLALGLPIDYVDLDSGRLDFDDDPAVGGVEIEKGVLKRPGALTLKH